LDLLNQAFLVFQEILCFLEGLLLHQLPSVHSVQWVLVLPVFLPLQAFQVHQAFQVDPSFLIHPLDLLLLWLLLSPSALSYPVVLVLLVHQHDLDYPAFPSLQRVHVFLLLHSFRLFQVVQGNLAFPVDQVVLFVPSCQ